MVWPQFPQYGCFFRWPEDGQGWIHPSDVPLVLRCLPSERVFRRDSFDGVYYHYRYGGLNFRLRPCLWRTVAGEGFDVGDQVETIGVGLQRELFVGEIAGMYYVQRKGRILYRLRQADQLVPRLYSSDQLRQLTEKAKVRPGDVGHPPPKFHGQGERIEGVELG